MLALSYLGTRGISEVIQPGLLPQSPVVVTPCPLRHSSEEQDGMFTCPPHGSPGPCKLKSASAVTHPLVLVLTGMPFTISLLPLLWLLRVALGCSLGPRLCDSLFCVVRDPVNVRGARCERWRVRAPCCCLCA